MIPTPNNELRWRQLRRRAIVSPSPPWTECSMPSAAASTGTTRATSMSTKSTILGTTAGSDFRPFPRRAAAVLQGRIFVVGGEAPSGTFHHLEAYDPKSDRWTSYARMPTPRHGLGTAVHAGRIYVISGGPTPGASYSSANEIFTP
jgi:hypothetical protein